MNEVNLIMGIIWILSGFAGVTLWIYKSHKLRNSNLRIFTFKFILEMFVCLALGFLFGIIFLVFVIELLL